MTCRFVVISDTHFNSSLSEDAGTWWNRTTESRSKEMGAALVDCVTGLSPDFVIHCGDIVGSDTAENFELGRSIMDRLGCPWYAAPGNHDSKNMAVREGLKDIFGMDDGTWSYTRDLGGIKFFFLDVTCWTDDEGNVSPALDREKYDAGHIVGMGPTVRDLLWLERELEHATLPSVLVTHAPVNFRDAYPLANLPYGKPVSGPLTSPGDFVSGFITEREQRLRLLDIVRRHDSVTACFAGHWHIHDAYFWDGVEYILTGALREYPYELRLVEYDGSRFTVSTHALDVPELRELSYISEWGNDWIRGTEDVREFGFSLR